MMIGVDAHKILIDSLGIKKLFKRSFVSALAIILGKHGLRIKRLYVTDTTAQKNPNDATSAWLSYDLLSVRLGRGNYTMGLREQLAFPEIDYDKVDRLRGLEISIVTTAKTDEESRKLLELLGMPFAS